MIGILGARGVGKTTYLVMLLRNLSNLTSISPPRFKEGEEYFFAVFRALFEYGAPPPTKPSVYYFRIRVEFEADGKKYELSTIDLPGGEIERLSSYCKRLLDSAHGLIILIEPINDYMFKIVQVRTFYKILEYLSLNWKKRIKKPIAITFSKNDIYNITNPAKTFWDYTRDVFNLMRLVEYYVEKFAFFTVSSLGAPLEELRNKGEMPKPIRVEEPFLWVIKQL